MNKRTLWIALIVLSLALSACGARTEMEMNREKWNAANIRHYAFELTVSCFCAFMDIMPVFVEVKDGEIVSLTGANGQPVREEFRQYIDEAATVEGLFAVAEDSLSNADQVEVTYDARYGFPTSIAVDWIELAIDDEIAYYVGAFEVLE